MSDVKDPKPKLSLMKLSFTRNNRFFIFTLLPILFMGMTAYRAHAYASAPPPCADLFISEYLEGASNNKAIELYNPTNATITLTGNYSLKLYFNGSTTAGSTIALTGSIAPFGRHVIANTSAVAAILAVANQTSGSLTFNGDDAIELVKGATTLDVFGQIGFDPGTGWTSNGVTTLDSDLRRKFTIREGDVIGNNAFDPSLEWDQFALDNFTGLGLHNSICECALTSIGLTNVACNDNGTPANAADDYITFSLNPTGTATGTAYNVTAAPGTVTLLNGNPATNIAYGSATQFRLQNGSAGGGNVNLTVTDAQNSACTTSGTLSDPGACAAVCTITSSGLSAVACNDNGTPSLPSDDYISFSLNPGGITLGSGYNVTAVPGTVTLLNGNPATNIPYGSATQFRLQNGSAGNGNVNLSIQDVSNSACNFNQALADPGACSSAACGLNISAVNTTPETCPGNNNGSLSIIASCPACVGAIEYSINGTNWFLSNTFNNLAPGNYTARARDAGNTSACTDTEAANVGAGDNVPPVFNGPLPQNITISCSDPVPNAPTLTATDARDPNPQVTLNQTTAPGTCPQNSTITRTWTATDNCGNSTQHVQTIAIRDLTPPVLNGLPAATLTISCTQAPPAAPSVTASDLCDSNVPVSFNQSTGPGSCPQNSVVTRTWSASDDCGNSVVFTQTINIVDNVPPVFNAPLPPANITVSCSAGLPAPENLTATDNCDPGQSPAVIFINEIHYDNAGTDVNEFIEVAGTAGINLANYSLVLYNGNGGIPYDTLDLSGIIDNEANGFGAVAFVFPVNGLQNGSPDGVALCRLPGYQLVQFLTYEGPMTAANGPAAGQPALEIPVQEDGTNAVGTSIQLTGAGQIYGNFSWTGPITASAGTLNAGQSITALPPTITSAFAQSSMAGSCNGSTIVMRMWTATDACGNSTKYTQTINVVDNTGPVFAPPLPANITLNCNDVVPPPATLTASDACDMGGSMMTAWINELHYDNVGTDVNEFVEVAGQAGTNLAEYTIVLYNGNGGGTYYTAALTGVIDNESNGFGAVSFSVPASPGIQNGSPDGVALVRNGTVIQFLSYEGTFVAVGGPANGMLSVDIGVLEDGTNAVGTSLRLSGTGNKYSDFIWNAPAPATPGSLNTGQTITALPPAFQITFNETMSTTPPANCPFGKTITRTWSVQDNCGNTSSHVQVITITDNVPPVVTCQPLTINLDIFGNAVVTPAQISWSATDNCSASTALTALPNTQTYTCAQAGTSPNYILSVQDQCGNIGRCTVAVSIPALARCVPKILISDPCVCKNNASTLEDGQFGETIKIEALAGKVWTVTQASGLYSAFSPTPPNTPISIIGTVLTENPINSGDYFLNGIHVDNLGYTVTIVSQQGEVLSIGNKCAYPNPEITSDLKGPFCLYSDPVTLTGNPGDANFVSAGFFVNGQAATQFNPGAGLGQYKIEYRVNGGVPKANGANDPGCTQSVVVFVNVIATPEQVGCNDLVYVSLDPVSCTKEITPDDILEGTYGCYDDYEVKLTTLQNVPVSTTVTTADIGKKFKATVKHKVSGNSCWGTIQVEDKAAPQITCKDVTITCSIEDFTPNYLKNVLKINDAIPTITDCSTFTTTTKDNFTDLPCGAGFNGVSNLSAYIERKWTVRDAWNNFNVCTQYIYLKRRSIQDVKLPTDVTVTCENGNTDPSVTGAPFLEDFGLKFPMYPNAAFCELNAVYKDDILPVCGPNYKILRTWTIYDWCLPTSTVPPLNPRYHIQVIKVEDNKGPAFSCPANATVSTDPFLCCSQANLPDVFLTDNCGYVKSLKAKVSGFDPITLVPFDYDVTAKLTDFPGNNYWNRDTLGVFGNAPCLPRGTHTVVYTAEDQCGTTARCSFLLNVQDQTEPVAACDKTTVVSLGVSGQATVNAETFDDGSYDNCGGVTFSASPTTFNCSQVGKTVMITLRVTDESGNTNECMIAAEVQDKLAPSCVPPANVTTDCESFDPSLWKYGQATGTDNCSFDKVTTTVSYAQFDTLCNRGTITRSFRAFDKQGLSSQCTQRIVVNFRQDYFLRMPDDRIVTTCDGTGNFGEPTFFGKDCEYLAVSFTDEIFTVVPDACFKIERTWHIINWCTYNTNGPLVFVPNPNPNATVNAPANLPGPIISAPGTASPWQPTVVKVDPLDPTATNYSLFYTGGTYKGTPIPPIASSNGFEYKQIIKVLDTQDPVVENCPTGPVSVCDLSNNHTELWNASYWWDNIIGSHDLCEGPTDLNITATDACSGSNISFRFLLFLDLDGDGSMETLVNSNELGLAGLGWNNIRFGSANGTAGTNRAFDERPVPANQKYGFALQTTKSGNKVTAAVRWNTQQAPNTFVVPELPYGTHKIKWIVEDGCGNESVCEYTFIIKDCKAPSVICNNGLSMNIMPTGMATLWAADFYKYGEDNCTPAKQLVIGIRKKGQGTGFPRDAQGNPVTSVSFNCKELGNQEVEVWAEDKAGNAGYCVTYVLVQDPFSVCATDKASIAGVLKTDEGQGLEEANVELSGVILANPLAITDPSGAYLHTGVPLNTNVTLSPIKDQNPLNGVSTYDLVLISKHILGLEPLTSPYRMIAADANKSNSITTLDIVELRKLILGIYTELPNNTSWRFVDKQFKFANPANPFEAPFPENIAISKLLGNMTGQDFIALKVGDVNASAVANSLVSPEDRSAKKVFFEVASAQTRLKAGEVYELLFEAAEALAGFQFTLELAGLEVLETRTPNGSGADHFGHFSDALTVSLNGDINRFTLRVKALKSGDLNDLIRLSDRITKAEAYSPNSNMKHQVALRFEGVELAAEPGFDLRQNEPNPFADITSIGFFMPREGEATLKVFEAGGRLLLSRKGWYAQGNNSIILSAEALPQGSTGVLWYTLETDTDMAVKKMIKKG